jgi:hypothetical protein
MVEAFVSVDVDTVDRHLQGYGVADAPACHLVYERAIPRLLDLAEQTGLRLTFFMLGRDANAQRALLRDIVRRGHEVASHSFTHPQPFRTLSDADLQFELGASRASLTAACGTEVVGFRAPAWDADERVLRMARAVGYRYDASAFPSVAVLANRAAVLLRSGGESRAHAARQVLEMGGLGQLTGPTAVHEVALAAGEKLLEIPISVTPTLRLPVYHTLTYLLPEFAQRSLYRAVLRSGRPLSYVLHAVDALGASEDAVDPRLGRHPGMSLRLDEKLKRLRQTFSRIALDYRSARLCDARELFDGRVAAAAR